MPEGVVWFEVSDTVKRALNAQYGEFRLEKMVSSGCQWYELFLQVPGRKENFSVGSLNTEEAAVQEGNRLHKLFNQIYDKGRCDADKGDKPEWT